MRQFVAYAAAWEPIPDDGLPATRRAPRPTDWQSGSVSDPRETLRRAYRAFNAREVDIATDLMHPEVDWPNAWEGGRVVGRAAVRDYWDTG